MINIEIFKLFGSIMVKDEQAQKALDEVDKKAGGTAKRLGDMIGTAAKWGTAIAAGVGTAVTGMIALANKSAETADKIDKMAERTGISRTRLQELEYAAGQCGVSFDSVQGAVKKLTLGIGKADEESKTMVATFDKLGISITDNDGKLKQSSVMFDEAIKKLAGMEDITERNILGNRIFGGSFEELIPLVNQGEQGMDALSKRAHELGLVMTDEAIAANVKFGDTMADVKQSFGAVVTQIGTSFLPIVQKVLDWVMENMPIIKEMASKAFGMFNTAIGWVIDNSNILIPILGGLLGAFVALKVIGVIITLYTTLTGVISAVSTAGGILNAILAANPIGLVVVAIGALIAAGILLYKNWETVKEVAEKVFGYIKEFVGGVIDGIASRFKAMVNAVIDNLNKMISVAVNAVNKVTGLISKVPGINISKIEAPEIPQFAKGTDYFKGGLALVGEEGPELVKMPRGSQVKTASETRDILGGFTVNIENFVNNRSQDVQAFAEELEFYRKQYALSKGGAY